MQWAIIYKKDNLKYTEVN